MERKYYLMNGVNGIGDTVNLCVDGKIQKEFDDISMIDLQTMDIIKKDAKNILREYNHVNNLPGMFYIIGYPFNAKPRSFAPIFNYNKTILNKYYDALRKFAIERANNIKNGNNLKLEMNSYLENYIYEILYSILNNHIKSMSYYESIISLKLKEIIKAKFNDCNYGKSVGSYLDENSIVIENILSNYTEVRNLTIEYILYLAGYNANVRNMIKKTEKWNNFGITKEAYQSDIKEYEQLELSDFMDISKVKRLKK